jgi:hypothetical protein
MDHPFPHCRRILATPNKRVTKSRQLEGINGGGASMKIRIVVFSIILILAIAAAIIAYREFVAQVPCGNDLFADDNGSFETGNFVPNANGGMDLLNGSNDLTDWTITVSPTSNNPICVVLRRKSLQRQSAEWPQIRQSGR